MEISKEMSELDVYIKIVSFLTPFLFGALGWLTSNHFGLKERVRVLEIEITNNQKSDDLRDSNYSKLWDAISEVNKTLSRLEQDIRVISERITK
jgi:hypothetical protein